MKQESIHCESCKRNTLHQKAESSGCGLVVAFLFCVIIGLFGGLTGIVIAGGIAILAVIASVFIVISEAAADWRCQTCGQKNPARRQVE